MPKFSPDGERIVFLSDRSGGLEVWTVSADGSSPLQLTNMQAPLTGSPTWTHDGSRIIFDSNKGGRFRLYSVLAAGGPPRPLTDGAADEGVGSYSRDGRWIYFTSNRTGSFQIWKMPAHGGAAIQMTKNGGRVAFESLDGKSVYYATSTVDGKSRSLWRIPADGGEETLILPSVLPFEFAVAKEGIYFVPQKSAEEQYAIEYFSFATGKTSRVLTFNWTAGGLSVSPDGRSLVWAQADEESADLMLVENFR